MKLKAKVTCSAFYCQNNPQKATMDIRLLHPSDIPHVQHANITNLPEKQAFILPLLLCQTNSIQLFHEILPLPRPLLAPTIICRSRCLTTKKDTL
jgi:hypothetical protein